MKVLFVSPEVAPIARAGGLGDVVGALPIALQTVAEDQCASAQNDTCPAPSVPKQRQLPDTKEPPAALAKPYGVSPIAPVVPLETRSSSSASAVNWTPVQ